MAKAGLAKEIEAAEPPVADDDGIDRVEQAWVRERPDIDITSIGIVSRIWRVSRHLERERKDHLAALGTDRVTLDVLAMLRRSGPPYRLTAGELTHASLITSGGVSQRLDKLEKAGLVLRRIHTEDRRRIDVELTPAGMQLVDSVLADLMEHESKLLDELTPAEKEDLRRTLKRLLARFEHPDLTVLIPTLGAAPSDPLGVGRCSRARQVRCLANCFVLAASVRGGGRIVAWAAATADVALGEVLQLCDQVAVDGHGGQVFECDIEKGPGSGPKDGIIQPIAGCGEPESAGVGKSGGQLLPSVRAARCGDDHTGAIPNPAGKCIEHTELEPTARAHGGEQRRQVIAKVLDRRPPRSMPLRHPSAERQTRTRRRSTRIPVVVPPDEEDVRAQRVVPPRERRSDIDRHRVRAGRINRPPDGMTQ
jgi:DNA-binding MarR family transcriptional regulator